MLTTQDAHGQRINHHQVAPGAIDAMLGLEKCRKLRIGSYHFGIG